MKYRLQMYVALFAATAVAAFGQSSASLSGTVVDPTGAAVPNAHVVVHSNATGAERAVDTDAAGLYAVPALLPGDYSVKASAAGFSNNTVPSLTLNVDSKVTLNLKLQVASAGETVQVEAQSASQIETSTITVGQVIDQRQVQQLPLNGRHFLDLTVLTPGGVIAPTNGSLTATSRGLGANSFITAGNREDSVNFQINGINLNDISQNQITFQPSISTTSEFKINNSDLQRGIRAQRWFDCDRGNALGHQRVSMAKCSTTSAMRRWMHATTSIAASTRRPASRCRSVRARRLR